MQRAWKALSPVKGSSGPNMACNTPGTPARFSANARAGGTITAHWNPWPHGMAWLDPLASALANDRLDGGPLSVWMVECPGDCASFRSPHTASWFKIYQDGLVGTQKLKRNGNSLTVTIPASLKPGNYLIRHELIVWRQGILSSCADKRVELGQAARGVLSRVRSIESYRIWKQEARGCESSRPIQRL